ncbi:hypothetical protein [Reyranella soli]|nr:hypothetical protein [Reyranella soli]
MADVGPFEMSDAVGLRDHGHVDEVTICRQDESDKASHDHDDNGFRR